MGRPVEFTPIEIKVDALLQESAFYLQSYRTIEAQNVLNEALRLVKGNEVQLWNNVWLKPELLVDFPILSVCNTAIRDAQTPVIAPKEVSIFDY